MVGEYDWFLQLICSPLIFDRNPLAESCDRDTRRKRENTAEGIARRRLPDHSGMTTFSLLKVFYLLALTGIALIVPASATSGLPGGS